MKTEVGGIFALGDEEFELFREIVYRESGINLTDKKKSLVQARLMRRLRELCLPDYEMYYAFLQDNYQDEIVHLINCITTNKTEFFRESNHFDYLRTVILPEFERVGKRRLRIWCAGCSTGEEPYSIAITVLEYFGDRRLPDVKMLANDIDTQVLRTAQEGIYPYEVVAVMGEGLLRKYFLRGKGGFSGLYRVKDCVKEMISFRRLNLLADHFPMKGSFDVIFCRNVIIYFDRPLQHKLFHQFYRYLTDDGYLILGHSEALTGHGEMFRFKGKSIYGKVLCSTEN
jgi:chemotaxis protein methyltransferase CheR